MAAAQKSPVPAAKETGSARVYGQLRQEILRVKLEPGSLIDEISLSERFGMSRSPIREALARLSSEGLVQILPNRSTVVAPIDLQSVPEFLDSLDLLQRVTTRSAALLRNAADLEKIIDAQKGYEIGAQESIDTGISIPMIESNYTFHMAIARAGKNRYFESFYQRLLNEGRRILHFHFEYNRLDPDVSASKMAADHTEMVEAIIAQDADRAETAAHLHAIQFKGRFMQYLNRSISQSIDIARAQATPDA